MHYSVVVGEQLHVQQPVAIHFYAKIITDIYEKITHSVITVEIEFSASFRV